MKKLLLLTGILSLTAVAFGANPDSGTEASSNVEVRAEVVDDSLVISDIYGKPLLLDFGKIQKSATAPTVVAEVDYKVTSSAEIETSNLGLTMQLNGGKDELVIPHVNMASQDSLTAKVKLDKTTGSIPVGSNEYRGKIIGSIAGADYSGKTIGMYRTFTEITVTVD